MRPYRCHYWKRGMRINPPFGYKESYRVQEQQGPAARPGRRAGILQPLSHPDQLHRSSPWPAATTPWYSPAGDEGKTYAPVDGAGHQQRGEPVPRDGAWDKDVYVAPYERRYPILGMRG